MLHHTVEVCRIPFHNRHIDGRDLHESPSIHGQVEPGAISSSIWRAIGKQDAALIPSRIRVTDGGKINGGLAKTVNLINEIHSAHVGFTGRQNSVVPREDVLLLQRERERENGI